MEYYYKKSVKLKTKHLGNSHLNFQLRGLEINVGYDSTDYFLSRLE
jgi:hypothetical protein